MKNNLPLTEELDFHYLLSLMPALHNVPEFAWLPELFSIIGHESLIQLCRYAGGEIIKVPTLDELTTSINSLQWFYDIYIKHSQDESNIPEDLCDQVNTILKVFDARNSEEGNQGVTN